MELLATLRQAFQKWLQPGQNLEKRLLVTGFEPFNGRTENTSQKLIELVPTLGLNEPGRFSVESQLVPVDYSRAAPVIRETLERVKPTHVLSFGEAPGAEIRLEELALNLDSSRTPDNAGVVRSGQLIRPHEVPSFPTRLALDRIEEALRLKGFKTCRSQDAGGFLCNHVFFHLMAEASRIQRIQSAGFIHVPSTVSPHETGVAVSEWGPLFLKSVIAALRPQTLESASGLALSRAGTATARQNDEL